jgi:ribosome-associated protein
MIEITPILFLGERELQFDFIRAAGPGGQNVNKVATAVQLRFNIRESKLSDEVKTRLIRGAGRRVTSEGVLVIEAKRFRTQEQNKEDAIARLIGLVRKALVKEKPRRKTKPTKASKEERLKVKKRRADIKKSRQSKSFD